MTRACVAVAVLAILYGCASTPQIGEIAAPDDVAAGTLTTAKGKQFRIRYEALTFTGKGTFEWPDGRRYTGEFEAGRPQGTGIDERSDGSRYEGQFDHGRRHGEGVLELPDGSVYRGEFASGARSGEGTFDSPSGRYTGAWHRDAPEGQGRFDYVDGSYYEGEWADGRRNGFGRYQRDADSSYEGDWENDLPSGFGRITERYGFSYEGGFNAGERSGYGVIDVGDGIGYAGTWIDNRRQGYGRETRPDGSSYEGEWRGDRRSGHGLELRADGSYHQGWWEDNVPLGPGTRRSREGIEISGLWNSDFVSSGVVILPSGEQYAGNLYELSKRAVSRRFLAWLEDRAAEGNGYAHLLLAHAYTRFRSPAPDAQIAQRHFEAAAQAGIGEAQFRLGELLIADEASVTDGLRWIEHAADDGLAAANLLLGTFYQLGHHRPTDRARAIRYYEAAVEEGDLTARNNLAWLLATSTDPALRDGTRALALIRPVAVLYDQWTYLDTLAAAYAEVGDFRNAVAAAQRAVALAEGDADDETLLELEARLRSFEANTPFRES